MSKIDLRRNKINELNQHVRFRYLTHCQAKKAHASRAFVSAWALKGGFCEYEQNTKIIYEGCSNMNASGFITFFIHMLRQKSKRFYKGLHVTFKLVPNLKKNTVYLSSYSPLNEGHVSILTNSMLRTYISYREERIILR